MADLIKCLQCSFRGAQTDFPCKPNLQYLKTCATCNTKQNESAGKKRATKENENPSKKKQWGLGKDKTPGSPPTFVWSIFNQLLTENKDSVFKFRTFVMLKDDATTAPEQSEQPGHGIATHIAKTAWDLTGFRFKFVTFN